MSSRAPERWLENMWLVDGKGAVRHALRPGAMSPETAVLIADVTRRALETPGVMQLGAPVAAQHMDWPALLVARSIPREDGESSKGAVVIALAGNSLADLFSQQLLGPHGSVALVRTDGLVVAHNPRLPDGSDGYLQEGPLRDALRAGAQGMTLRCDGLPDGGAAYIPSCGSMVCPWSRWPVTLSMTCGRASCRRCGRCIS